MAIKQCTKCGKSHETSMFSGDKSKADGLHSHCKPCRLDAVRKRRGITPERYGANKKIYASNAEKLRAWKEKNPEKYREQIARRDKDKQSAAHKRWRSKNIEAERDRIAAWAKANSEKAAANAASRRAARKQAIPMWANRFFIGETYDLARVRSLAFGMRHVVDHIVPLVSPLVCGLHVESNLRVITEAENATKGNRYWPHMPGA